MGKDKLFTDKLVKYTHRLSLIDSVSILVEEVFQHWSQLLDFEKGILTVKVGDRSYCITKGIPQKAMEEYLSREERSHLVKSIISQGEVRLLSDVMAESKEYKQFVQQVLRPKGILWGIGGPIREKHEIKGCIRILWGDNHGEVTHEEQELFSLLLGALNQAFSHLAGMARREHNCDQDLGNKVMLLTKREKETLDLMLQGMSNIEIAIGLGIKERTVKAHVSKILKKFNATDRMQVIIMFLKP